MSFLYVVAIFLFLFLCMFVCLVILIQEGKGGGLGASFGGGDPSDSLFGASTPEVLKQITAYLAVIFVCSCVILSFWTSSLGRKHMQRVDTEIVEQKK